MLEDEEHVLSLDKCTESNQEIKLFKSNDHIFYATVRFSTDGTKIITILQEDKQSNDIDLDESDAQDKQNRKVNDTKQGRNIEIGLKGLGISMIDNKPQELLYMRLNDFNMKYNWSKFKLPDTKDMTEERIEFMMDIGHIQIDNLISEEMPVLLGAKSFYDRNLLVASQVSEESR